MNPIDAMSAVQPIEVAQRPDGAGDVIGNRDAGLKDAHATPIARLIIHHIVEGGRRLLPLLVERRTLGGLPV